MLRSRLALVALGALALSACGRSAPPAASAFPTEAPAVPSVQAPSVVPPTRAPAIPVQPLKAAQTVSTTYPLPAEVQHGPAPTLQSIVTDGPYTVKTAAAWGARGFGGGTLYFPANPGVGERFGGIVTMSGFTEPGSSMAFFGKRLASHGFVVLVANPVSVFDYPSARARAVVAAVSYLQSSATVNTLLDPSRMAVIGHSMGGGGVLEAAETLDLDAVIALHPWAQRGFPGVTEPTHIVGGLLDNIAPVNSYTLPIYNSLVNTPVKSRHTHLSGTHWAGVSNDPGLQARNLAFLKTFVDGDTRYVPFYCAPSEQNAVFTSDGFC